MEPGVDRTNTVELSVGVWLSPREASEACTVTKTRRSCLSRQFEGFPSRRDSATRKFPEPTLESHHLNQRHVLDSVLARQHC